MQYAVCGIYYVSHSMMYCIVLRVAYVQVREDRDFPGFAFGAIAVLDEAISDHMPTAPVPVSESERSQESRGRGGGGVVKQEEQGEEGRAALVSVSELLQRSRDTSNITSIDV